MTAPTQRAEVLVRADSVFDPRLAVEAVVQEVQAGEWRLMVFGLPDIPMAAWSFTSDDSFEPVVQAIVDAHLIQHGVCPPADCGWRLDGNVWRIRLGPIA